MTTLEQLRRQRALSKAELARMAKVHQNTIAKTEKGTTTPEMRTIRKIARALEVEPSAIAWPGDPLALASA